MISIPLVNPIFRLVMRCVSIVVWALTILAAYGGRFNPEYLTIPSVLCLTLPYLVALSVILILFWLITRRIFFTALGVLAMAACIGPVTKVMPLNTSKEPTPGATTFKIMSWNVLHTDDIERPESPTNRAVEYMIESGADVICLAELDNFSPSELRKASPALIDSLIRTYPFRAGLSSTDIKVLSKYPVDRAGITDPGDFGRQRFDFFKVRFPRQTLTVGMVHLYSYDLSEEERQVVTEIKSVGTAKSSVKEFKGSIMGKLRNAFRRRAENAAELRKAIDSTTGPLIVCGDFNDVPNSWAYDMVVGDDMRDAYIETNFGPSHTYRLHMFYFHIDQMLYRGALKALDMEEGKIKTSDHYPLIGEFEFTKK